jgi:hypothetical protein
MGGGGVSLYPWRPQCGCLIVEGSDGEPELAERCQRDDGCTLVVIHADYPPVTSEPVEPFSGSPAPTHQAPPP